MTPFGLRFLRPGFARTPEMDRAFALGWPEMRVVGASELGLPNEIAGSARFVWREDEAATRLRERFAASKMVSSPSTFGAAEALAFARHLIPFGWLGFEETETDVFLLEGLVGAPVLAAAMTAALEEISANEWRRSDRNALANFMLLGFVLLRADEEVAIALRARLETLFERRRDEGGPLHAALDLVLHGGAGARRSALRHGAADSHLDPASALLVDDDPSLIAAVVRGERFARWDRRFAARLAFLGDDGALSSVAHRWFRVGDATAQRFFLGTAGTITSPHIDASMKEAANAALVRDEVATWLEARGLPPVPPPEHPAEARADTLRSFEVDEFGFVLLPLESARLLRGDDDHTILCVDLDPTSLLPAAPLSHGRQAIIFCRTYDASFCASDDGLLFTYAVSGDEALDVFGGSSTRRFVELATITVESTFVGLPASLAFAEAEEAGQVVELPLAPGRYLVREALLEPEDDAGAELAPLLWFERLG